MTSFRLVAHGYVDASLVVDHARLRRGGDVSRGVSFDPALTRRRREPVEDRRWLQERSIRLANLDGERADRAHTCLAGVARACPPPPVGTALWPAIRQRTWMGVDSPG
jgi:hypothetical protein